jgi:hypothetical protein
MRGGKGSCISPTHNILTECTINSKILENTLGCFDVDLEAEQSGFETEADVCLAVGSGYKLAVLRWNGHQVFVRLPARQHGSSLVYLLPFRVFRPFGGK